MPMKYFSASQLRLRKRQFNRFSSVILLSKFVKFLFVALILLVVSLPVITLWVSRDLPTPGKLSTGDIRDSTKITDRNGVQLFSIYKEYNRTYVNLSQIPEHLKNATLVAEDREFYQNKGFSLRGYLRAFKDFIIERKVSGGSTITQQLVKNVLLSPERTFSRKLKELFLSLQVERRFSKDQILEMYLNNVSYGGTSLGVETASDLYFGKKVKDITLAEAAFLAALPQAPSRYSPFTGKNKAYVGRTEYILKQMWQENYISKKQMEEAMQQVSGFTFSAQKPDAIKAPHFVMYVREQLEKRFGSEVVEQGNLQVKTTLDYEIQKKAEEVVF